MDGRHKSFNEKCWKKVIGWNNGSPKARFFTDDDRRAVTVEIPIHPDFLNRDEPLNEPQSEPQNKINEQIIELVKENNHISRKEMAEKLFMQKELTLVFIQQILKVSLSH